MPRASGGPGRAASSRRSLLVALIVLAFGLGTDYEFTTYGVIPTAAVTCALDDRPAARRATTRSPLELLRVAGVRRRVVLVGEGEQLARLHRTLGAARGGIGYDFVGAVARRRVPGLPQLGAPRTCRGARRGAARRA